MGRPIAILACGGSLPLEIARRLAAKDYQPYIVAVRDVADADFSGFPACSVGLGEIGGMLQALRRGGAEEMMIAGHLQRPDLLKLKIDLGFVRHVLSVLRLTRGGDDGMMRNIASFFESKGFRVRGVGELTPELLTPHATLAGAVTEAVEADALAGMRLIQDLGRFDIGQAIVLENGSVLGIEGAEGTNGLINRQSEGLVTNRRRILVKATKPGQDVRLDLPTIGPETIERCNAGGFSAVAIEAGRSLIVAREETAAAAQQAGMALFGFHGDARIEMAVPQNQSGLRLLTRKSPGRLDVRNLVKGHDLMTVVRRHCPAKGVILARENVLAINVAEPMADFVRRAAQLGQWGDRRRRNRGQVLVVSDLQWVDQAALKDLLQCPLAGVSVMNDPAEEQIDQLIAFANDHRLFVVSAE